MSSTLEDRLTQLEDINAIHALKWRYSGCCDDHYNPDGIAALFAEDGVWEADRFGRYVGRSEIRRFMAGISTSIPWAFHGLLNPCVEVAADGRSAFGSWYSLTLCTMTEAGDPQRRDSVIMSAVYRDDFVKVDDIWRFQHLRCMIHQISNLDEGWARHPFR